MKKTTPEKLKRAGMITVIAATIVSLIAMPVFAWFYLGYNLAIYAPVSSPESLYIGAGHCDSDHFEEARYIYFDTMEQKLDDEGSGTHWDKVFCVYGKMVSGYRIQLAFTTNKQFTYELYEAEEENEESASTIVTYTTHTDDPTTYYYKIKGDKIEGGYLNQSGTDILADSSLHESTYGDYSVGNVHKYAQPLYWQTTDVLAGQLRGDFAHYYILRVRSAGEMTVDRETDVICIAAKSFSVS